MTSWVHVFSKFTPEALLFEALLISVLLAGYAAFWVLRKRRLGALDNVVPTGVVKTYLNELILDAERLRAQLFGLLSAGDAAKLQNYAPMQLAALQNFAAAAGTAAPDPEAAQRLQQLEAQMSQQSAALESVMSQKVALEAELLAAKAAGASAASGPADQGVVTDLQNKLRSLENKLAEYSVIEDDLANLKRLQQENAQLRASLAGGATAAGAPIPAPVAAAPAPQPVAAPAPAAAADPLAALSGSVDQSSIDNLFASPAPAPAPAAEATAPAPAAPDALFEGLVDQVEKSLQPDAPAPAANTAAAAAVPAPAQPSTSPAPAANIERSDADLVAEFEKMLNG